MANNVLFRQHTVVEFLVKVEIPAAIFTTDFSVCMEMCALALVVLGQWVKHFKDGNMSILDQPRSSRPQTASTEPNKKRADEIINEDRCVTQDEIATKLGTGHNAVQEMIEA